MTLEFGIFDHLDHDGGPLDAYYDARLNLVELLDKSEFYGYHVAEHHSTPLGMAPSPSVFLAAVAARTKRIRLGPLVYALPLYHPLRLVQEICMLDQMSKGRLDIGFGRGASPIELGYFGCDPADSERIYREYLDLILTGLAEGRLNGRGEFHSFDDVPILVEPYQKPHPQLWYGVHAVASAERAARMGSYIVSLDTAEETRAFADRYREVWWETWGEDGREPLVGLGLFVVVGKNDKAALRLAERAYPVWHKSFNYLFERHGKFPVHQRPPDFAGIAAEGRAVAGSPATVEAFLREKLTVSGANYLVGQFIFGDMKEYEARRSIELFTSDVIPKLRVALDSKYKRLNRKFMLCPVCGLKLSFYPWGEDSRSPTFAICECCGAEYGYHDSLLEGIRAWRQKWIESGAVWHESKEMPENWSLEEQLNNLPDEYR